METSSAWETRSPSFGVLGGDPDSGPEGAPELGKSRLGWVTPAPRPQESLTEEAERARSQRGREDHPVSDTSKTLTPEALELRHPSTPSRTRPLLADCAPPARPTVPVNPWRARPTWMSVVYPSHAMTVQLRPETLQGAGSRRVDP